MAKRFTYKAERNPGSELWRIIQYDSKRPAYAKIVDRFTKETAAKLEKILNLEAPMKTNDFEIVKALLVICEYSKPPKEVIESFLKNQAVKKYVSAEELLRFKPGKALLDIVFDRMRCYYDN